MAVTNHTDDTPTAPGVVSFRVRDAIAESGGERAKLNDPDRWRYVMLHRVSAWSEGRAIPDAELTGAKLAMWQGPIVGVSTPCYHFVVRTDGTVDQCLSLSSRGAHAYRRNTECVGVAVVGDFRNEPTTVAQDKAMMRLLPLLLTINGGLRLVAHDELANASSDPNKHCPGRYLKPIAALEAQCKARLPPGWESWSAEHRAFVLSGAGVAF